MKFKIEKELTVKNPAMQLGFVILENLELKAGAEDKIEDNLLNVHEVIASEYFSQAEIDGNPEVAAFLKGFQDLGLSEGVVSLKSMLEIIALKGKKLVLGHPLIDFYNSFVLRESLPAGAYDLDRVVGDVILRASYNEDKFKQLNKDEYKQVGETVVFADSEEVLCTNWVHKQSDTHKIRPRTKYVMFRLESCALSESEFVAKLKKFESELKDLFEFDALESIHLNKDNLEDEIKLSKEAETRRFRFVEYTEILTRGVSDVIVEEELMQDLIEGKKLRIKHGVDPTTSDLHLGYAVNYEKMRAFQERGHQIVFLIGTFTGRFGDPTDKSESRKMRDKKQVEELAKNYLKQLARILDIKKVEVVYNADWFDKMSAEDILRLMSEFTVARMLERDMFQKRIKDGKEIGLHEIVYPLLQGYDSVEIKSDLTVIGTDQTFNELQARPLQKFRGQKPQNVIAMKLLVGTDGTQKMSQSLGNYVGFDDTPEDKFGKLMSIPDHLILTYFEAITRLPMTEIRHIEAELKAGVNPRDIKMKLAMEVVTAYDGEKAALKAKEAFINIFQKGGIPDEIAEYKLEDKEMDLRKVLVESGLLSSSSDAGRMIKQGAVKIDGEKVGDSYYQFKLENLKDPSVNKFLVQVGKRKFIYIVL